MKALNKMDNLDRGELLGRLFPEQLESIQNFIGKECEYFLQNETAFRQGWPKAGFFTAEFWYRLVEEASKEIERNQDKLWKRPRWFADHFFDGYNSLFAVHCLIEYAETKECDPQLKEAIHLIFGCDKIIVTALSKA